MAVVGQPWLPLLHGLALINSYLPILYQFTDAVSDPSDERSVFLAWFLVLYRIR